MSEGFHTDSTKSERKGTNEGLDGMSLSECCGAEHKGDETSSSQQNGEWKCEACTVMNRANQTKCYVCKTKKGESKCPLRQTYQPWKDGSKDFEHETRVVILGASRDAEVKVANLLLDQQVFESVDTSIRCEIGYASIDGRSLFAVYAPALFAPNVKEEAMNRELWRMVSLAAPGPHVFLFVVDSKPKEDDQRAIETLLGLFGKEVVEATVRVAVGGTENAAGGENFEQRPIQYGASVCLSDMGSSHRDDVLEAIKAVMRKKERSYFQHKFFADAGNALRQRRRQTHDGVTQRKLDELEKDLRKLKSEREEDGEKIKKLKSEIRKCKAQVKEQEEKLLEKDRKWLIMDDKTIDQIITIVKEVGGFLLPIALAYFTGGKKKT